MKKKINNNKTKKQSVEKGQKRRQKSLKKEQNKMKKNV